MQHGIKNLKSLPYKSFEEIKSQIIADQISIGARRDLALEVIAEEKFGFEKSKNKYLFFNLLPFVSNLSFIIFIIASGVWWLFWLTPLLIVGFYIFHPNSVLLIGKVQLPLIYLMFLGIGAGIYFELYWLSVLCFTQVINWLSMKKVYGFSVSEVKKKASESKAIFSSLWNDNVISIHKKDGTIYFSTFVKHPDGSTQEYEESSSNDSQQPDIQNTENDKNDKHSDARLAMLLNVFLPSSIGNMTSNSVLPIILKHKNFLNVVPVDLEGLIIKNSIESYTIEYFFKVISRCILGECRSEIDPYKFSQLIMYTSLTITKEYQKHGYLEGEEIKYDSDYAVSKLSLNFLDFIEDLFEARSNGETLSKPESELMKNLGVEQEHRDDFFKDLIAIISMTKEIVHDLFTMSDEEFKKVISGL